MNTATAKSSASRLKTRIICTAAVLALCGLSTRYASADSSTDPTVTRSDKVSMANFDISTPEGAHAARARLRETARRLCSQVADSLDLSHHSNYVACVDATVDAALRKVNELLAATAPGTPRAAQVRMSAARMYLNSPSVASTSRPISCTLNLTGYA